MKTVNSYKGFVVDYNPEIGVMISFPQEDDVRLIPVTMIPIPYKGLNVEVVITIEPGTMVTQVNASKRARIVQLWNFYIRGRFTSMG